MHITRRYNFGNLNALTGGDVFSFHLNIAMPTVNTFGTAVGALLITTTGSGQLTLEYGTNGIFEVFEIDGPNLNALNIGNLSNEPYLNSDGVLNINITFTDPAF